MSITYCVMFLFFLVLCTLWCQLLWIVRFWFPLRCSLNVYALLEIYVSEWKLYGEPTPPLECKYNSQQLLIIMSSCLLEVIVSIPSQGTIFQSYRKKIPCYSMYTGNVIHVTLPLHVLSYDVWYSTSVFPGMIHPSIDLDPPCAQPPFIHTTPVHLVLSFF